MRELAVEAFELGGCSGLARCDFFVEPDGAVLVNEINTMPGFTETSVYAKLWEAAGLDYPDLCDRLRQPRGRAPPRGPLLRVLSARLDSRTGCESDWRAPAPEHYEARLSTSCRRCSAGDRAPARPVE